MAAPEHEAQSPLIYGPGLPQGTQYVRPVNVYGAPMSIAIPVINGPIDDVVRQFLGRQPF